IRPRRVVAAKRRAEAEEDAGLRRCWRERDDRQNGGDAGDDQASAPACRGRGVHRFPRLLGVTTWAIAVTASTGLYRALFHPARRMQRCRFLASGADATAICGPGR